MLALTANAAAPVRAEIAEQLGMREVQEIVAGFDRPNIHLEVVPFQDDAAKRRFVVERAAAEPKPGIVYAATRRDAEAYAAELAELNLSAAAYHAGLRAGERSAVHDRFTAGELDVVVATSAFGMGIDKADVRFVLHASVPGSLDAYYQEIGRAGRDGEPARAVLAYRSQDLGMQRFFAAGGADAGILTKVADEIRGGSGPVAAADLRTRCDVSATRLSAALNLLEQADAVRSAPEGSVWAEPGLDAAAAVEQALRVAEGHRLLERSRVDMMRGYAETTGCGGAFCSGTSARRCGCRAAGVTSVRRGGRSAASQDRSSAPRRRPWRPCPPPATPIGPACAWRTPSGVRAR